MSATDAGQFRIFINYRREDAAAYAGRLYDSLGLSWSADQLFMDIDTIPPGVDFVEVIQQAVGRCDALIAFIGPHWLDVADTAGRRRLENPEDFVRLEIEAALARNVRVIPVLVQGAVMPLSVDLPESLRPLTRRNAVEISDTRWRTDVERLVRALRDVEAERYPPPDVAPTASLPDLEPEADEPEVVPPESSVPPERPAAVESPLARESPPPVVVPPMPVLREAPPSDPVTRPAAALGNRPRASGRRGSFVGLAGGALALVAILLPLPLGQSLLSVFDGILVFWLGPALAGAASMAFISAGLARPELRADLGWAVAGAGIWTLAAWLSISVDFLSGSKVTGGLPLALACAGGLAVLVVGVRDARSPDVRPGIRVRPVWSVVVLAAAAAVGLGFPMWMRTWDASAVQPWVAAGLAAFGAVAALRGSLRLGSAILVAEGGAWALLYYWGWHHVLPFSSSWYWIGAAASAAVLVGAAAMLTGLRASRTTG